MRLRAGAGRSMKTWRFGYTEDMVTRKRTRRIRAGTGRGGDASWFTAIVESAMDAIITLDERHHVIVFNAAAERIFRCRAAEALGHPLDRFIPERFRVAHRGHVKRFGATGATVRRMGREAVLYGCARRRRGIPDRSVDFAGDGERQASCLPWSCTTSRRACRRRRKSRARTGSCAISTSRCTRCARRSACASRASCMTSWRSGSPP